MDRDIEVRMAASTDASRIHEIHTAAARTVCAPFYAPAVLEGWLANRTATGYLKSIDAQRMFVAELDSLVVGFGEAAAGEVVALFVDPAFGGRGVGAALLRHALVNAGDGVVHLESTLNAVSFYERFGFVQTGRSTVRRNQVEVPVVLMERSGRAPDHTAGECYGAPMTEAERIALAATSVLLVDWPSRDVPDALVRAGYSVTVRGGPEADAYSVHELRGGEVLVRRTGRPPEHVDLVYCHRPLDDLPGIVSLAKELGATAVWRQSGLTRDGAKDPKGCWVSEDDSRAARSVVEAAGLAYVDDAYIADVVSERVTLPSR